MSLKYSCCSSYTLHDKQFHCTNPILKHIYWKFWKDSSIQFFLFNSTPRSFFVMTNWRFTYYSQLVAAKWKQEKITEYLPKDNDVIRGPTENKNRHNYNCHLECFCSCPIQHSGTWTSKPHIWIDKIEIWLQFW